MSCDTSYFKEVSFKIVPVLISAFPATSCLNLSAKLKGFPKFHIFFSTVDYFALYEIVLIALSIQQIEPLKSSAIGNLYLTVIRLTRNFLVIEIVRCYTTQKASVFPYLLLFYWEFEPCCLRHTFSTVGHYCSQSLMIQTFPLISFSSLSDFSLGA